MINKNKIEGILKNTSSASFNWSFLSGSVLERAEFWGISDPKEYRRRIALAQLADTLLIKDKLLLGDTASGLAQVFHAFGPALAIEVLKLGRVIGLTVPGKRTSSFESLCYRRTDDMPELLDYLLKDLLFVIRRSKREQNLFIQTGLDNILEITSHEHEKTKKIATAVSRNWLEKCADDVALSYILENTTYIYSRITDHWKPTEKELEKLFSDGVYLLAYKLAQGWYCGVPHSLFEPPERHFIEIISKRMDETSKKITDTTSEGFRNVLEYNNLPTPGMLVMRGKWGPRQVFECITSPEAEHLRDWMNRVKSGDFLKEYTGSEGSLPKRKEWSKWIRFATVAAVSSGFTFALTMNPVLATALGIGAGAIDTAYGERLSEALLPSWYPRIWVEHHARDVRMTTKSH